MVRTVCPLTGLGERRARYVSWAATRPATASDPTRTKAILRAWLRAKRVFRAIIDGTSGWTRGKPTLGGRLAGSKRPDGHRPWSGPARLVDAREGRKHGHAPAPAAHLDGPRVRG